MNTDLIKYKIRLMVIMQIITMNRKGKALEKLATQGCIGKHHCTCIHMHLTHKHHKFTSNSTTIILFD